MHDFPQPHRLGGSTRWAPNDIQDFETKNLLELPSLTGMATVRDLAARYRVSVPTIWRWTKASRHSA